MSNSSENDLATWLDIDFQKQQSHTPQVDAKTDRDALGNWLEVDDVTSTAYEGVSIFHKISHYLQFFSSALFYFEGVYLESRPVLTICDRFSQWWLNIAHTENFERVESYLMCIISISDHISDLWVVIVWMTISEIPISISILSLLAFCTTTILPIAFFREWYVKVALPFGFGNHKSLDQKMISVCRGGRGVFCYTLVLLDLTCHILSCKNVWIGWYTGLEDVLVPNSKWGNLNLSFIPYGYLNFLTGIEKKSHTSV